MARRRVDKFSSLDSVISRVPIEIVLANEKRRIWKKAFFEDELFEERKNRETERERERSEFVIIFGTKLKLILNRFINPFKCSWRKVIKNHPRGNSVV